MIRFMKGSRSALLAGLFCPLLASAQDAKPAESATTVEVGAEVIEFAPTLTETSLITEDLIGVEVGPDSRPGAKTETIRRIVRTQPGQRSFTVNFDSIDSKFGLNLAPVDEALRAQLEIPKGEGVVVVEVKAKSLAEQAGVKPKDVLLSLGDKPLANVPQAQAALLALGKEAVQVKLIREGKSRQMSLVGPEHGFTAESAEFWIGVPVSPVDAILRAHLAELPADSGLIANDVVKDSPADKAGVKKNDILVSLGGKPLKSSETLIAQVQASGGKAVPLVLVRAGKSNTVEVTPTRRAHPTAVNFIGTADGQGRRFTFFQPNVAVEVQQRVAGETFQAEPSRVQTPRTFSGQTFGPFATKPGEQPNRIELELLTNRLKLDNDSGAKIEAQLKELSAKVEEIRKAIDGLKKAEGK